MRLRQRREEPIPPRPPTLSSRIDDIASDLKAHIEEDHTSFDEIKLQLRNIQQGQAPHTPTAEQ